MSEWKKPSREILKHQYTVIIFDIRYEDDEIEEMDIFYYDGIRGIFVSQKRNHEIKYKEIKFWFPLPKNPRL